MFAEGWRYTGIFQGRYEASPFMRCNVQHYASPKPLSRRARRRKRGKGL
jgi:hypothetical protein